MKNTTRQYRLDALRLREAEGTLTKQERVELDAIFAELDAEEAVALKPAQKKSQKLRAKLRQEKAELELTSSQLQDIINMQQKLSEDARAYLAQLRSKRAVLADKYQRLTGQEVIYG